jgi:hypothetical protein
LIIQLVKRSNHSIVARSKRLASLCLLIHCFNHKWVYYSRILYNYDEHTNSKAVQVYYLLPYVLMLQIKYSKGLKL